MKIYVEPREVLKKIDGGFIVAIEGTEREYLRHSSSFRKK